MKTKNYLQNVSKLIAASLLTVVFTTSVNAKNSYSELSGSVSNESTLAIAEENLALINASIEKFIKFSSPVLPEALEEETTITAPVPAVASASPYIQKNMESWLKKNVGERLSNEFSYVKGHLTVQLIVDEKAGIAKVTVPDGFDYSIDNTIVEVVKEMPINLLTNENGKLCTGKVEIPLSLNIK